MYNNAVFSTKFPNPSELLCIFATMNSYERDNMSYFNQIILKSRQLIFEMTDVIAYPETDRIYGIQIVVKEDFYKTGQLHSYLEKHNLRISSAQAVQNCTYEKCCLYTIISKLSPKWNQISNYLVYGRNFLMNESTSDSVQLKFNINDTGNAVININVNRIKLSKITLNNLYLTDFEQNELKIKGYIRFKECNIRSIQVLPSLKRGKIIALYLKLNKNSSIETYQEMRRYWKNTYGYRLPETDEDIFYVDISFFQGSQIFTYPNLCVRFYETICAQQIDPNPIVSSFMASLKKYVPIILDEYYPIPNLGVNTTDDLLTISKMVNLPRSCETSATLKKNIGTNYSTCERLKTENNELPKEEPKSKLSQLLEELNKNRKKTTIYLTPQLASNQNDINFIDSSSFFDKNKELDKSIIENTNRTKNDGQSKSISEDLKEQLDFLTASISQRSTLMNSSQLKRELVLSGIENVKVLEKKRRIVNSTF